MHHQKMSASHKNFSGTPGLRGCMVPLSLGGPGGSLAGPALTLPSSSPEPERKGKWGLGVTQEGFVCSDSWFPTSRWNPSPLFLSLPFEEFPWFMSAHGWHNVTFRINEASEARRMPLDWMQMQCSELVQTFAPTPNEFKDKTWSK